MSLPKVYYFTDEERGADPLQMAQRLPSGCGIIYRHYKCENRTTVAILLSKICKNRKITLIVSQDPHLATDVGADGCHLPEYRLNQIPLIKTKYPRLTLTAACHSARALIAAEQYGTDAAFLSPVFPTQSHPEAPNLGVLPASSAMRNIRCPVFALGGVTFQSWRQLSAMGFAGFGAISQLEKPHLHIPDRFLVTSR